jgi:hypothetical protein
MVHEMVSPGTELRGAPLLIGMLTVAADTVRLPRTVEGW